jgi:hypothetical protein
MLACWGMASTDFSRYAIIIERRPFASVEPEVAEVIPEVVTVAKPPAFVKDLRMCAITERQDGLRVGFVNKRKKQAAAYFLRVGESEDGIELVDADYMKKGALLRKGGEQYWMYMGDVPAKSSRKTSPVLHPRGPGTQIAKRGRGSRLPPGGVVRGVPHSRHPGPGAGQGTQSYADRRRQRLEEMQKKAQAERDKREAEIDKKLQEYQKELIRKGLTPLPIPLSEDADRELVQEGVLPPMDGQ